LVGFGSRLSDIREAKREREREREREFVVRQHILETI
jgi:hypothetical protein